MTVPRFHVAAFLLFALLFSSSSHQACAQGHVDQATVEEPTEKTPEISTAELRSVLREHRAIVIDTRPYKEYAMGHIPGALDVAPRPGVPLALYISDVDEVGRIVQDNVETPIVLYGDGPFSEQTRRLGDQLVAEGYVNVRRYQLGISVWRALGGTSQVELAGIATVIERDRTALLVDARDSEEFKQKTVRGAMNLPRSRLTMEGRGHEIQGGHDGDLPLTEDRNTRIIVFGDNEEQSSAVAEALAREDYTNVSFFAGSVEEIFIAAAADNKK